MKKWLLTGGLVIGAGWLVLFFFWIATANKQGVSILSPLGKDYWQPQSLPKPLLAYTFENLSKREYRGSQIDLEKVLSDEPNFISYLFVYESESPGDGAVRRISGSANLPKGQGPFPVVILLRGYADRDQYETGTGTQRAASFLATNGFLTLAPDFLGFGQSEMPPNNVLEDRFLRPVAVLDLLASLSSLKQADQSRVFFWAHSNGGQIALSVLEISQKPVPTTLWAPVSKPFPYSILYYTDEAPDRGKMLRKTLADFETDYDVDDYSIDEYFDRIRGPLIVHQGTADEAVPQKWSVELVEQLKKLDKEVTYYLYPAEDHNFSQGSWTTLATRDLEFFRQQTDSLFIP